MSWSVPKFCCAVLIAVSTAACMAKSGLQATAGGPTESPQVLHDGQRDFDWEIGTWQTQLKRRMRPLTGSNDWVEYSGTTTVSKIWGGRANWAELDVAGAAGKILGGSLRLYNPESRRWSLNFANAAVGEMTIPTTGDFSQGQGRFYSDETLDGKPIRVRFIIRDVTQDRATFEQAFSADGGKSWEVNWVAVDTRVR